MSSYRDFVKEMMPKMMSHPPKERLKMIAGEWRKKKGVGGGYISAAGLDGGRMSAAGLPDKKKRQKIDLSVASSNVPFKVGGEGGKWQHQPKAVGGMLGFLKLGLPEGMKDSNKLSVAGAKKLADHIAVVKGKEFAHSVVSTLKKLLDSVGKKKTE